MRRFSGLALLGQSLVGKTTRFQTIHDVRTGCLAIKVCRLLRRMRPKKERRARSCTTAFLVCYFPQFRIAEMRFCLTTRSVSETVMLDALVSSFLISKFDGHAADCAVAPGDVEV